MMHSKRNHSRGPSSLKRAVMAAALSGGLIFLVASAAMGQSLSGGCQAAVNGRTAPSLTKDNPLKVAKGQSVQVVGTAPAGAASGRTNSHVKILTPFWAPDISFGPYKGKGTSWGGNVKVPDLVFTLATGVYKVEGNGSGTGWRCKGTGYIQIGESSPAEAAIGGGLILGGGAAVSSGRKPKGGSPGKTDSRVANSTGGGLVRIILELAKDLKKDYGASLAFLIAIAILFVFLGLLEAVA